MFKTILTRRPDDLLKKSSKSLLHNYRDVIESRPLYNETKYDEILKSIIKSYYRDFHDHENNFQPIFLINDIIRFWRTLCLNYEHKRNREKNINRNKNKSHLMNLKLKFSRLLICFSFIILLLVNHKKSSKQSDIIEVIKLSPWGRLEAIMHQTDDTSDLYVKLQELYIWFLETTGKSQDTVLDWIGEKKNREIAFNKGREFAELMYSLLMKSIDEDHLRFLVI